MTTTNALCRFCGKPQDECFEHCHHPSAIAGKHVPDPTSVRFADTPARKNHVIYDVWCKLCGISGATSIDPSAGETIDFDEIQWE